MIFDDDVPCTFFPERTKWSKTRSQLVKVLPLNVGILIEEKLTLLWHCSHRLVPHQTSRAPSFTLWRKGFSVLYRYCASSAQNWGATVRNKRLEIHWQKKAITETVLSLYPSLTRPQWRRNIKQWSMYWRKFFISTMAGLFAMTWRWCALCWDNNPGPQGTHTFCVCGIVEKLLSITR